MGSGASKDSSDDEDEKQRRIRRILNLPTTPPQSATSRKNSTKGHYDDSDESEEEKKDAQSRSSSRGSSRKSSSTFRISTASSAISTTSSSRSIRSRSSHHLKKRWEKVQRSYVPVEYEKPRPSIFPAKKWSKLCPIYVDRLDKAMDGIGTDEQSLIEIICGCSSEQRSKLKSAFKTKFKEDLLGVMREELSGNFSELALALFRDPMAFDIDVINVFVQEEIRWNTLIGLLINKTPHELTDIAHKFETLFKRTITDLLNQKITDDNYLDIFLCLFKEARILSKSDASPKSYANELMSNTGDPNAFKNILCSMIFELGGTSKIREVCEAIRQMYNAYLIDVIDEVLTDDEGQEAYKAAVAACDDTAFFFAGCINDCLDEKPIDDDWLMRLMISRSEIDLRDIDEAYEDSFKHKLVKSIKRKTSGEYQDLLIGILRSETDQK